MPRDTSIRNHGATGKGRQIKVAIVGAGIAGLAVANGLSKDPQDRYDVQVYERDDPPSTSERGGYQLRISSNGLNALRTVADTDLFNSLREIWAGEIGGAPTLVDPNFNGHLRLADVKLYPASRPVMRTGLRAALLQPLLNAGRVHFNRNFTHFDYASDDEGGVQLNFKDDKPEHADILIAADGSNSPVNRQVGLQNKVKLDNWFLIQSRGPISPAVQDELPRSLKDAQACMFLGGDHATGYASIYAPVTGTDMHTLFWSMLVPAAHGERMMQQAGNDHQKILPSLIDYLRHECGYNDSLPFIIQSAPHQLRTGKLTSSVKPTTNWRTGNSKSGRVILLGDAVHPMTPARGMGANQALVDAGNLVKLLHAAEFSSEVPSDEELNALVAEFDTEMYGRAFKMVKASEDVSGLDLMTMKGKVLVRVVHVVLTLLGWGASVLEVVGLRKPENYDYDSHHVN